MSTKDICNSPFGLITALLQKKFSLTMKFLKVFVWNSQFFVGNPKICLFSCFANTCVPPVTPKKGIPHFGVLGGNTGVCKTAK